MLGVVTALVIAVVTALLISQSSDSPRDSPTAGASTSVGAGGADGVHGGGTDAAGGPSADIPAGTPITPKAGNIPMTKLKVGDKPPQFILFSFDGAGRHDKLNEFLAAAAPTDSRFTGFLTGLYLLEDSNANLYTGPGAKQGSSEVGFGGDQAEVVQRINDLNNLYALGDEIGTHYNGHFCDLGANWSTDQWNNELDQFYKFFTDWKTLNNLPDAPALQVPASEVKGGRTPCLAGKFDQLTPAWKAHNMIYDSSGENAFTGIAWPQQESGIWQFPIPTIYSKPFVDAGFKPLIKAMDYNFWFKFNKATEDPSTAPKLTEITLDTYRYMYQRTFNGNRAPVLIANHFNDWNGNSFNPAALQFMTETCGKPDTICTTYQDLIAWMQLQDPAVLAALQALPPVADTTDH